MKRVFFIVVYGFTNVVDAARPGLKISILVLKVERRDF